MHWGGTVVSAMYFGVGHGGKGVDVWLYRCSQLGRSSDYEAQFHMEQGLLAQSRSCGLGLCCDWSLRGGAASLRRRCH
jgi:hypothetical protein